MSSRALRRLQNEHGPKLEPEMCQETDSEEEEGIQNGTRQIRNRFHLLDQTEENAGESNENEDSSLHYDIVRSPVKCKERSVKKQKKKRQKKNYKLAELPASQNDDMDDFFELANEPEAISIGRAKACKPLLAVELKHLNPDNEMKRIFGSKVVQSQRSKHGRARNVKTSRLITPKHWPDASKSGISMFHENGVFRFQHSKQYQGIQHEFLDAVESSNPDAIAFLVRMHPYHVDSLIQLSDLCRLQEDHPMATEFLERALYCFENSFHPLFNLISGNCRLDYRYAENRSLFIVLFKHLNYVGQRGCCRTALELCKVLLSLNPELDPLAVILMIDHYALRSEEYSYLIELFDQWNESRNLYQLPNFSYSVPLALFLQSEVDNNDEMKRRSDDLLQAALIAFPNLLLPLLSKCGAQLDVSVHRHNIFAEKAETEKLTSLDQLTKLYVCRNFNLWKDPKVLNWLEMNGKEVIKKAEKNASILREAEEKRNARFKASMPKSILRHIILSGYEEATVRLPPELAQNAIFCFDPIPPSDSIQTYMKPERTRRQAPENRSMFGMFLHSLMPNYDPTADVVVQEEDGATAGRAGTELQNTVSNLLDAMRDLLNNIQMAPPPIENRDEPAPQDENEDVD